MNPIRDSDSAADAQRLEILLWTCIGAAFGAVIGFLLALLNGWPTLWTMIASTLVGGAGVYGTVQLASRAAGEAAFSVLAPSGRTTRAPAGYSDAEALAVRGRYVEAIALYERYAAEEGAGAEPCLRIARLYRDRLNRPEDAVAWYRRARDAAADPGEEYVATLELVEVLVKRLAAPRRALPELARLAERQAGTPGGEWARRELKALRASVWQETGDSPHHDPV